MFVSKYIAMSVLFAFPSALALPFPPNLGAQLNTFVDSIVDQVRGTYKFANLLVATGTPSNPTGNPNDLKQWKLTFENNAYTIEVKVNLNTGREEWKVTEGRLDGIGEIRYPFRPRVSLGEARAKIVKKGYTGTFNSVTLKQLNNPDFISPLYIFQMSKGKVISVDSYNGNVYED